jgi:DNA-directed RNA polymerase sigma subunit (sigma70/sigma32)
VNFVKQSANLWAVKQKIQRRLAEKMGAIKNPIHIVDGFPMPVREFARVNQSECFKGEASYGYCASKQKKYYTRCSTFNFLNLNVNQWIIF